MLRIFEDDEEVMEVREARMKAAALHHGLEKLQGMHRSVLDERDG